MNIMMQKRLLYMVSRQKTLLKRRKIMTKKRPISQKRLKEQRKHYQFAHEVKVVQMKKELDKKRSVNHHLNELMDTIFYPDMRIQTQENMILGAKHQSVTISKSTEHLDQIIFNDQITQELRLNELPLELLEVYQKYAKAFEIQHYLYFMYRIKYYCHNYELIKKKRMSIWNQMQRKARQNNPKLQKLRCPFIFLEKDDIPRHEQWQFFVSGLFQKIKALKSIDIINEYLQVLLKMNHSLDIIPVQLYQIILEKNTQTRWEEIKYQDKVSLIKLIGFKSKVKFNSSVTIETPEKSKRREINLEQFAKKISMMILEDESCSLGDMMAIIHTFLRRQYNFRFINNQIMGLTQNILTKNMSEVSFEDLIKYFQVYVRTKSGLNEEFLEIIKYDIFRKCSLATNKKQLLHFIFKIKGRMFQIKGLNLSIQMPFYDILCQATPILSKFIAQSQYNQIELIRILDCCFNNAVENASLVELLSTEIIKNGSKYKLEELASAVFKIILLGHRSKILVKYVFNAFFDEYHKSMSRYANQEELFLPNYMYNQEKISSKQEVKGGVEQILTKNIKQVYLEEHLIIVLWSVLENLQEADLNKEVKLERILKILPLLVQSSEIMIKELVLNINCKLKPFQTFPEIQIRQIQKGKEYPQGKYKEFYRKTYSQSRLQILIQKEAQQSKLFNCNYNTKEDYYLEERWSNEQVFDQNKYLKHILENPKETNCYFNKAVVLTEQTQNMRNITVETEMQKKRQKGWKEEGQGEQEIPKKAKLYQLVH